MHNPELSKAVCSSIIFLLYSVCVHVGVDVGVDVCKQIFVDMYVEASGTPSTVLGFLWWFIGFGSSGLSTT